MTKLHTISRIADESKGKCLLKKCDERYCARHRQELLVYCLDCMEDFCPRCYSSLHKQHRQSSVRQIIDEYSELVEAKINEFLNIEHHAQKMKEEMENKEDAVIKQMDLMEVLVTERSEKIKMVVDTHTKLLQGEINSLKQKKLGDIKVEKEQVEKLQANVIGFREDCAERKEFPNIESVILMMNLLKAKAEVLTQLHEACLNRFDSSHLKVAFKESDIDGFLGNSNVVGQVTEVVEQKDQTCNQTAQKDPEPVLPAGSEKDVLCEYAQNPRLIQTIKTRASTDENRVICGIAVLNDELFIVHEDSPDLYVYDVHTLQKIEELDIDELNDPRDIASCDRNECLYIFDCDYDGEPYRIFRLDTQGSILRQWITGKSDGSLSVTYDCNVVVAYREKTILKEYSEDGRLIRELAVCPEQGVNGFLHARKLSNDFFLISYSSEHKRHGLCLVDDNGDVLHVVSKAEGLGDGLNVPCFFAVDGEESIFLVDKNNRRVVLFSSDLETRVELVTKRRLHYPLRVLLNESSGRLFVVDNWYDFRDNEFRNGRVLVFQVKSV